MLEGYRGWVFGVGDMGGPARSGDEGKHAKDTIIGECWRDPDYGRGEFVGYR